MRGDSKKQKRLAEIAASQGLHLWSQALLYAIPVSVFIIGLFYYWFAIADRYAIFLYGHLGATPFDERTTSRYWMSGLVASGAVMVLYTIANWFLGRVAGLRYQSHTPPAWWRVWLFCALPLAISIPAITMTVNRPTLPPSNAAECVVASWVGLALALMPGSLAAQRPLEFGWLVLAGIGLMPNFLLLRVIELPSRGLVSASMAYLVALGSILAGAVWLVMIAWLQARLGQLRIEAGKLLVAGLCLSYLLMPLAHHLLFTPPEFRYISASTNFFTFSQSTQIICFFVAAVMAAGVARWQRCFAKRSNITYGRRNG